MQVLLWCTAAAATFSALVTIAWLFHRICTRLEKAGYLYYRQQGQGGATGSILGELDKLVRPSIQHTIQVKDKIVEQHEIDGD